MKSASKTAKKKLQKERRAIKDAEKEKLAAAAAVVEEKLVEKAVADKERKKKKRVRDNKAKKAKRLSNADFKQRRIKHEKSAVNNRSRRSRQAAKIQIGLA